MSALIEDYQGRLDDLLTEASVDDIEDEEDKTLCVDFGGKSLIISIVSNDEQPISERLH